jgi:chloramphenicol-sensitive protein RarD
MENKKLGTIYALLAYVLWGILPLYWKLLEHIEAKEILSYRIVASFFFMIALLIVQKNWSTFLHTCRLLWREKKRAIALIVASLLISVNWFIYVGSARKSLSLDKGMNCVFFFDKFIRCVYFIYCLWYI